MTPAVRDVAVGGIAQPAAQAGFLLPGQGAIRPIGFKKAVHRDREEAQ